MNLEAPVFDGSFGCMTEAEAEDLHRQYSNATLPPTCMMVSRSSLNGLPVDMLASFLGDGYSSRKLARTVRGIIRRRRRKERKAADISNGVRTPAR